MRNEKESKGIVYVAHGSVFLEEAITSAKRAKEVMPDIPICIITDQDIRGKNFVWRARKLFDHSIHLEYPKFDHSDKNVDWGYKPYALSIADLPYEKCMFLDTDTYMIYSIRELFRYVHSNFDIALCEDRQDDQKLTAYTNAMVFNSGMMVFNNSEKIKKIFNRWWNRYERRITKKTDHSVKYGEGSQKNGDQVFLADILYNGGCRFIVLRINYNFRYNYKQSITNSVSLLHGRSNIEINKISEELNSLGNQRTWDPATFTISLDPVHKPELL